ncbi:metallophosphoesterase [Alkalicoccus saliphilus]|jgi:protein phosphatase|uniref:Calcineurin-like phosphoesterase domain-containing protein n=1 Tax=Alkalicoccus saliphilus TaxID=200989 RepID=A0A2T4U9X0_9BACI|nr:metallophosphoesterase [Alkalicoccus saliphilus]PTL40187.1 hypothetical protein C6Y45_02060 [Alkalicoccus saliphilus]
MYDVIGDVHGCRNEMHTLLRKLGYKQTETGLYHPESRIPVFLGDLTDRGPDSLGVIKDVSSWVKKQQALYCPGNHCDKLYRFFIGRDVRINNGLETTIAEWEALSPVEKQTSAATFRNLYENAPLYLMLDSDNLVVAHAGIRHKDLGRKDRKVKSFVLYGDVTGAKDKEGFPIRRDWPEIYPQGENCIVYGHTPVIAPRIAGKTVNIDTGCVFGGALTAFRYPEKTFVSAASEMPRVPEKFKTFPDGKNEA